MPDANAATASWLGTTSGDWSDDSNWSAAHPNAATDVATFNLASSVTTINVGNQTVSKLLFAGASLPSYTLQNGTLLFASGIIVEVQANVVAPQVIASHFDLGGLDSNNPEIKNHSPSSRLTLSGNFTSLVKGTRGMTVGGNSTAAVTECSGNFTSLVGAIQMQVQKGTGIFSGTSTFSNLSVTDANNLVINGTTTSPNPVVINNSALLGGTGTITTNVNVIGSVAGSRTGAIVSPGDFTRAEGATTGSLDVSGNFSLVNRDAPTDFRFEFGGATPGDGAGHYDQLNAGGSVSLGLNNAGTLANSTLSLSLVNGHIPAPGAVYYILSRGDGGAFGARTFAGLPEGASVDLGGGHMGTITYLANWQGSQAASSTTGGNDIAILAAGGADLALPLLEVVTIEPADGDSGSKLTGFLTGGTPNTAARVEASSDLGGSDPWETVGTVTLDGNGAAPVTQVEDPGSIGAGKSFFRIAVP